MKSSLYHSKLPKDTVSALQKKARGYSDLIEEVRKHNDYSHPESSLFIAGDKEYQSAIRKKLGPFKGVKRVILVAIGGSIQGTHAVYKALSTNEKQLTIVDSVEEDTLKKVEEIVNSVNDSRHIALVIVSKSGTTTETMLNSLKIIEMWERKFGDAFHKRVIFIGNEGTEFLALGEKRGITCFSIPGSIGGRFSVFTAVGIVPLTLLGINVAALTKGAVEALAKGELRAIEKNAVTLAAYAETGVHTVNFFTFNKRLELLGFWYRQLLAESIGKDKTTAGEPFTKQLLPVVSTSTDLHSVAELYLGGYKGIYTHFIYHKEGRSYRLPTSHWMLEHVPFLKGKKVSDVKDIITESVLRAYNDQRLPYRYTEIDTCTAHEVGAVLATLMAEVMYLGNLFDIDTFGQPSVEFYKKYMRTALTT